MDTQTPFQANQPRVDLEPDELQLLVLLAIHKHPQAFSGASGSRSVALVQGGADIGSATMPARAFLTDSSARTATVVYLDDTRHPAGTFVTGGLTGGEFSDSGEPFEPIDASLSGMSVPQINDLLREAIEYWSLEILRPDPSNTDIPLADQERHYQEVLAEIALLDRTITTAREFLAELQ